MIDVYFDDIPEQIIKNIQGAKYEIIASLSNFNDLEIFSALEKAIIRGVKVNLLIPENEINLTAPFKISNLQEEGGIVTFWDSVNLGEIFYSFLVIDSAILLSGGVNMCMGCGVSNKESIIFVKWEEELIKKYLKAFENLVNTVKEKKLISKSNEVFTDYNFLHIGNGGFHGFRNKKTGELICKIIYDDAKPVNEGIAAVKLFKRWGYINMQGIQIIQHIYEEAEPFIEGLAAVRLNKKWGYINKKGVSIIPFLYNSADSFSEGLAIVQLENNLFFIDQNGIERISINYERVKPFNEGLAEVIINGKYGFIDKTGKEVIPIVYDYAYDFKNGMAVVKLDGKYGVIDTEGKIIVPIEREKNSLSHLWMDI
jgi:hypothetical protein